MVEDQVLIRVRVSVRVDDAVYWHEGYSSQLIARYTYGDNVGKPIDIGNVYKSAMSKSIKTAVAKWGVALRLGDDEGSLAGQPGHAPSVSPAPANPPVEYKTEAAPLNAPVNVPSGPPVPPPVARPTNPHIPPKAPEPTGNSSLTPPSREMLQADEIYLTDVQKVAIETIMSVHDMKFEALIAKAIDRTEDLPKELDEVKYQDAVKLIQYGNNQ
ncbi:MAG: hypothetical protein ACXACY_22155, partial [Candidatus Hodarchaeales archaeon]|jgi:hypothetical protein